MKLRPLVFLPLVALPTVPVHAEAPVMLYPVHIGAETARYERGTPTVSYDMPRGSVQIRPLPVEDGRVAFSVAVFNKGMRAANFGTENISATVNGSPASIPTYDQLVHAAETKAHEAKIGTALLAGVLAGVASTASNEGTYYRRYGGPGHGHVEAIRWHDDSPGRAGAAAVVAGGAMAIRGIDDKLDYTLEELGGQALRTTTIDPGASFGGMIIVSGVRRDDRHADIRLAIDFDGVRYPFAFRLAPVGAGPATSMPATQPVEANSETGQVASSRPGGQP
ncbi:hypothetical protein MTR62_13260 [Novosphingobium sp. 1949]|uniref:DUF4424 domain-containing protein n=1 Tax=Novosphingobium organovorum TaxID=2930092 RepID=A0ABT0BF04_9SPHN|nr:hypothetical protein [Novosphingobium organovorum]MCJ2183651.1 hypothetical protein [Novosphingobium organovorum]